MFGKLEPEDNLELEAWADESDRNRAFLNRFSGEDSLVEQEIDKWNNLDPEQRFLKWKMELRARRRAKVLRITGWSAAACLAIAFAIGGLVGKKHPEVIQPAVVPMAQSIVMPGKNTATLTLGNGRQILLDSVGKGLLATQGNTRLVKADSGSLAYETRGGAAEAMTYNILTTPRSGQFQLTLPDGTKVWLNNVSSLRYPTAFQGKDRRVELLTGEAFFDVAKDAARPFVVDVKDADVMVLGTSFNIMAYPDEGGSQTTLLSGAVAVKAGHSPSLMSVRLKPDEQAQITPDGGVKILKDVPSADIVSWKDGFFYFERASFATVMRQLARWYDVDVVYQGKAPDMEFGGKIDRSLPLNDLLKFLDKNQIHFRLEGRKLIVLPS